MGTYKRPPNAHPIMPTLHNIFNFGNGLVTSAAWAGRVRDYTANLWNNLRITDQGYLAPRDGHTVIEDSGGITQVFAHKTLLLIIQNNVLKWGQVMRSLSDIEFSDFDPVVTLNAQDRHHFQSVDDWIFVGNGNNAPIVVDATDITSPKVYPFYITVPGIDLRATDPDDTQADGINLGNWEIIGQYDDDSSDNPQNGEIYLIDNRTFFMHVHNSEDDAKEDQIEHSIRRYWRLGANIVIRITDVYDEPSDLLGEEGPNALQRLRNYIEGADLNVGIGPVTVDAADIKAIELSIYETIYNKFEDWTDDEIVVQFEVVQGTLDTADDFPSGEFSINYYKEPTYFRAQAVVADDDRHMTPSAQSKFSNPQLVNAENGIPLTMTIGSLTSTEATHIDIYRTRSGGDIDGEYFQIRRIPYPEPDEGEVTTEIEIEESFNNNVLNNEPLAVFTEDTPHWYLTEVDNFRLYAIERDSNRLWMSYFDGISDRRHRTFTDFIDLQTGGEPITALKLLRENVLAAYTPHFIILVQTDPLLELTQVTGRLSSVSEDEAIGCIAPESIINFAGYHYFLSPQRRIMRFGGRQPVWASSKVQSELDYILVEISADGTFDPVNAIGVAHEGQYLLSYPSRRYPGRRLLCWRDRLLEWRDGCLVWRPEEDFVPNTTLILDTDRQIWYRDGYGVSSFTTDQHDRLYGVTDENLYLLYDPNANEEFEWEWKSNRITLPPRTKVHNVFVHSEEAAGIDVTVETEQAEVTQSLSTGDPFEYYKQRAGFNLKGETMVVGVRGTDKTTIRRIAVNQQV